MSKLIVRRGMRPEYYGFLSLTAVANGDEVIVDRRRSTNSRSQDGPGEQESHERRSPVSGKWIDEDVIVIRN